MTRALPESATGAGDVIAGSVSSAARGPSRPQHYQGADILRLVAAGLVVLFHLSETGGQRPSWPVEATSAPLGWLQPIAWMGWIGVQMFFVLSGFLISASAVNSAPLRFLKKRTIRIFPALWISCVISLVARALWGEPLAELFPALLRSAFLSPKGPYLDGVVWSLVVEAAFYIVIAASLALSHRKQGASRTLLRTAYAIGYASSAFAVTFNVVSRIDGAGQFASAMGSFAFDVLLLRQGMFFAIGILLFHLVDHRPTRAVIASLGVFGFAACVQIVDTTAGAGNPVVPIALWFAVSALMFASVKFPPRALLGGRMVLSRNLGLMTYPLYLNHFVLSQALMPLLVLWLPGIFVFPAIVAILLANAWLIAVYPERWLQDWLAGAMSRSTQQLQRSGVVRLAWSRAKGVFGKLSPAKI